MADSKITVSKLLDYCLKQMAKGNGHKVVFISSDDEGNDRHELFYGFTDDRKDINECIDKWRKEDIERYHKLDDIILLG